MKNQGQILAKIGSTKGSAVVAWDGLSRDEVLDILQAVLGFVELKRTANDLYTVAGLNSGRTVTLFPSGKLDFADLDKKEEG